MKKIILTLLLFNLAACSMADANEFRFENYDMDNPGQEAERMRQDLLAMHPIGTDISLLDKTMERLGASRMGIDGGVQSFDPRYSEGLEAEKRKILDKGAVIHYVKTSELTEGAFTISWALYPKDKFFYSYREKPKTYNLVIPIKGWYVSGNLNNGIIESIEVKQTIDASFK